MRLVRLARSEATVTPQNDNKVLAVITAAVGSDPMLDNVGISMKPVFGVIEGPVRIEAACGILPMREWDTDEPYLYGFYHFVDPRHRQSTHARSLYEFGSWFADTAGLALVWVLLHDHDRDLMGKERLMRRQATRIGALYRHEAAA